MQMLFCVLIFFVWEYFFFMKKILNKNFFNNNSKDLKPVRLLLATLQTGNTVCHVWLTLTPHISQPHFLEILFEHFAPFILSIRGSLLCLPPPPPPPPLHLPPLWGRKPIIHIHLTLRHLDVSVIHIKKAVTSFNLLRSANASLSASHRAWISSFKCKIYMYFFAHFWLSGCFHFTQTGSFWSVHFFFFVFFCWFVCFLGWDSVRLSQGLSQSDCVCLP